MNKERSKVLGVLLKTPINTATTSFAIHVAQSSHFDCLSSFIESGLVPNSLLALEKGSRNVKDTERTNASRSK